MKEKVVVLWSGGKDSALALYEIMKSNSFEVAALLTTMTNDYDRISIHGVRRVLLERQAEALGFPLEEMFIVKGASDVDYERELLKLLTEQRAKGVVAVVCGDIFLEDVRKYRERLLDKARLKGVFPLWNRNTAELARGFLKLGFKAVVTVVDGNVLSKEFAGRDYDEGFLSDLPANVDPCGENGEFHSFVYDGPIFREKIAFKKGEVVLRENRFYYCDLLLAVEHEK
ncbi:diphthine--ammonia ligase [Candidatus Bathyarchaeota archaeon A05DMB-2]|nr:diphthine--ammonia ligase [Candidatus Bathyarchaeota archaeon A05DMB-2]